MTLAPRLLENDVWQVGLLPETGMSTAFGRVKHGDGGFVDFMRPTPETSYERASDCANYLLVPWSNRVKDGRFVFRGKTHHLKVNAPDGSAIHGTGRDFPWAVEHAESERLVARFDSRRHDGSNFPFPFTARAEFCLDGRRFSNRLSIRNESREAMPAGFGHHPYFQRSFSGSDDAVRVQIPCAEYFELDACIPSAAPIPVDSRVDFRALRPLDPNEKIDDCLTGRRAGAPIRFVYARSGLAVSLELDALFENVVVYAPAGTTYFAVEPVTNANDGFNLYERGVRGSGVFVLEPDEERAATFVLSVER